MAERKKRRKRAEKLREEITPEPSSSKPTYEFSELQNQRFTRLAGAMQFVAVLEIACGLAFAFVALPVVIAAARHDNLIEALKPLGAVVVPPIIGAWTYRAANHLRLIVRTEGDDITHLMAAMSELTKLYILQMGLWLLATIVVGGMIITSGVLNTLF